MKYALFMNSNYMNSFPTYESACNERDILQRKFRNANLMIISYDELEVSIYGEKQLWVDIINIL